MSEAALKRARERALKAKEMQNNPNLSNVAVRENIDQQRPEISTHIGTDVGHAALTPQQRFQLEREQWKAKKANEQAAQDSANNISTDPASQDGEDKLILKGRQVQQATKSSLANSIKVASEASTIATSTLTKLNEQKQQMLRMDDNLSSTNESLDRSNRLIKGMKSISGYLSNMWTKNDPKINKKTGQNMDVIDMEAVNQEAKLRSEESLYISEIQKQQALQAAAANNNAIATTNTGNNRRKHPQAEAPEAEQQRIDNQVGHKLALGKYTTFTDTNNNNDNNNDTNASTNTSKGYQSAKAKAAFNEFDACRAEEDQQLEALGGVMDTLKLQAGALHTELHTQAVILEHIDNQIDKTSLKVKDSTKQMRRIT